MDIKLCKNCEHYVRKHETNHPKVRWDNGIADQCTSPQLMEAVTSIKVNLLVRGYDEEYVTYFATMAREKSNLCGERAKWYEAKA